MSGDLTFDLEPNPFERSFADKKDSASANKTEQAVSGNKHDLQIPHNNSVDTASQKLPGITPPLLTPGGRKLPPLTMSGHMLNPGTPGINLWNSLLTATSHHDGPQGSASQVANGPAGQNVPAGDHAAANGHPGQPHEISESNPQYHHQYVTNMRNSGLTPNESNLRSGLTPGGLTAPGYQFGNQAQYLNNPAMLANPMTPGLSSLLGYNQLPVEEVQTNTENQGQAQNQPSPPAAEAPTTKPASKVAPKRKAPATDTLNKRKKEEKNTTTKQAETTGSQNEDEEDKRKVFLERNRVAASKCRKRKKQLMVKMEEELAFYSSGYRSLSSQVAQLRDQLVNLRGIIVAHKDCPKLAPTVGGYDELQTVLQDTNFLIQMTSRTGVNNTLIPTTIPTTLNPQEGNGRRSRPVPAAVPLPPQLQQQIPPQFQQQMPASVTPHHLRDQTGSSTRGSSDSNVPTEASAGITPVNHNPISSHHSLTDLPAHAQGGMEMSVESNNGGDLRTINSMSNLGAMRQPAYQGGFRPAASMVDLGQLSEQQPNQTSFGDQRGYVGVAQSQS